MNLKQIIDRYELLDIHEKRSVEDKYVEVVILNKQIGKWNEMALEIFGPALKPAGVKPTRDVFRLTKQYGGIRDDQALFKKELDGNVVLAMFWPWQDGIHTTLKMGVLPAHEQENKTVSKLTQTEF